MAIIAEPKKNVQLRGEAINPREVTLMHGRGLREDVRRDGYARILDADPVGARGALVSASGPKALTTFDHTVRDRRKPCRIFRGAGDVCERPRCGHLRSRHTFVWKKATRSCP